MIKHARTIKQAVPGEPAGVSIDNGKITVSGWHVSSADGLTPVEFVNMALDHLRDAAYASKETVERLADHADSLAMPAPFSPSWR